MVKMYYQVYLDVLFFMNFCLDFLLLHFTKSVFRAPKSLSRSCLGGALGALGNCLLALAAAWPFWLKILLSVPVLSLLIVWAGFPGSRGGIFWKRYLTFLGMTFLLGGLVLALQYQLQLKTGWALAAGGAAVWMGIRLFDFFRRRKTNLYEVRLCYKGEQIFLKGLYDTGNHLVCPWNGKGVHVVDEACMRAYIKEENGMETAGSGNQSSIDGDGTPEGFFYIPFSSVGKEGGIIKAVQAEELKVFREEGELLFEKPILALGKPSLFTGKEYHVILHSEILN